MKLRRRVASSGQQRIHTVSSVVSLIGSSLKWLPSLPPRIAFSGMQSHIFRAGSSSFWDMRLMPD